MPRPDIRCPHAFKLFDPLSNKEISGKVTLTNVDRPDQPPFILRVPGDELKLSDLKEGMPLVTCQAGVRFRVWEFAALQCLHKSVQASTR